MNRRHFAAISALSIAGAPLMATERRRMLIARNSTIPQVFLIDERFEEVDSGGGLGTGTDGYDSSLVSAETGTPDNDYATSPAPLSGSRSLYLDSLTGPLTQQVRWTLSASKSALTCYFLINSANFPALLGTTTFFTLSDASSNDQCLVYPRTGGTVRVYNGGTNAETVGTMAASTTYHCWVTWATDGTASFEFQTDGIRRQTGNNYASVTGGNGTAAVSRVQLMAQTGSGLRIIFDKLLVSETSIGSNPA